MLGQGGQADFLTADTAQAAMQAVVSLCCWCFAELPACGFLTRMAHDLSCLAMQPLLHSAWRPMQEVSSCLPTCELIHPDTVVVGPVRQRLSIHNADGEPSARNALCNGHACRARSCHHQIHVWLLGEVMLRQLHLILGRPLAGLAV